VLDGNGQLRRIDRAAHLAAIALGVVERLGEDPLSLAVVVEPVEQRARRERQGEPAAPSRTR